MMIKDILGMKRAEQVMGDGRWEKVTTGTP